jgi:frataxin-like iron-binding protein CyaY
VGLLPVPHPIVIRKYQANAYTNVWFSAYLWGVIFLRNQGEWCRPYCPKTS